MGAGDAPAGGNGWVNACIPVGVCASSTFCADGRVNTLLASLDDTLTIEDGTRLASLVSPVHGLTVYLWRYGFPTPSSRKMPAGFLKAVT